MQYTLRNVPDKLDRALRERARREGRSLNEVAIDALARAMGLTEAPLRQRSLRGIRGSWQEDPAFDAAIADQHRIDEELWK
jgi:plasmid stability protein